jgi:hypothetical protein
MIYLYWEGDRRHWYYSLCLETIRAHNPSAVVLGPDDVEAMVGPMPPALAQAYIAHKVDWIRKVVLHSLGGMWLDMDFICFQQLDAVAGLHACFDFVGYKEWGGSWMDNFFVARKGSPILRSAADYALSAIRTRRSSIHWVATSTWAQTDAIECRHPWGYWMQIPTHLVEPVNVNTPDWFLEPPIGEEIAQTQCFGFMTSFHVLQKLLPATQQELLNSNTRLAEIFRRALGARKID